MYLSSKIELFFLGISVMNEILLILILILTKKWIAECTLGCGCTASIMHLFSCRGIEERKGVSGVGHILNRYQKSIDYTCSLSIWRICTEKKS